jgi:uroporphyrinogen-III synthase
MKNKEVHILCTRSIEQSFIEKAALHGVIIDALSFISIRAVTNIDTRNQILEVCNREEVVVFSSVNAVDAVAGQLGNKKPSWKIYCVGKQTARRAAKMFPDSVIISYADYGTALAPMIITDAVRSLTFFCGNLRRPELPEILQKHQVAITEIEVYTTELTPHKCSREYDGVIFFSPSAVQSFFSVNNVSPHSTLFAIGTTTARSIEQYASNKVITTDAPGKQQLIELVIGHFQHINQN